MVTACFSQRSVDTLKPRFSTYDIRDRKLELALIEKEKAFPTLSA